MLLTLTSPRCTWWYLLWRHVSFSAATCGREASRSQSPDRARAPRPVRYACSCACLFCWRAFPVGHLSCSTSDACPRSSCGQGQPEHFINSDFIRTELTRDFGSSNVWRNPQLWVCSSKTLHKSRLQLADLRFNTSVAIYFLRVSDLHVILSVTWYPQMVPSWHPRSSHTRRATLMAAIRRGCVTMMLQYSFLLAL